MNMRQNILIKSRKLNLGPQSIKENKIEKTKRLHGSTDLHFSPLEETNRTTYLITGADMWPPAVNLPAVRWLSGPTDQPIVAHPHHRCADSAGPLSVSPASVARLTHIRSAGWARVVSELHNLLADNGRGAWHDMLVVAQIPGHYSPI